MKDRRLPNPDDMPEVICPKCGGLQPDYDGFGVLSCQFDDCEYCSHPTSTGGVCGTCGETESTAGWMRRQHTGQPLHPVVAEALRHATEDFGG